MKVSGENPFVKLESYLKHINNKDEVKTDKVGEQRSSESGNNILNEDKVVLSPRAKEIQEAKTNLSKLPEIQAEKVARIKKNIEEGTYQVDGNKIAAKMIKESLLNKIP